MRASAGAGRGHDIVAPVGVHIPHRDADAAGEVRAISQKLADDVAGPRIVERNLRRGPGIGPHGQQRNGRDHPRLELFPRKSPAGTRRSAARLALAALAARPPIARLHFGSLQAWKWDEVSAQGHRVRERTGTLGS